MIKGGKSVDQLKHEYAALGIVFEDDITLQRAIIFYDSIVGVYKTFTGDDFKNQLVGKAPKDYDKIQPVFTDKNLLMGLCQMLDKYIIAPINDTLKKQKTIGYSQLIDELCLTYPKSVEDFKGRYPRNANALVAIAANFQNNIFRACQRILKDWDSLQHLFAGGKQLKQLLNIQSTGSDFHKGGQQVLILTFSLEGSPTPLNIIYKPSDLEVDCLIIGNTEALTGMGIKLQNASLMEILNQYQPKFPFPTYKILPINPGSTLTRDKDGSLPIHESYGYIEFLNYDGSLTAAPNTDDTCEDFYLQLGQIAAVACAFSLTDLHLENLIVHLHKPYLIDLETGLIRRISTLSETGLLGQAINGGAITGILRDEQKPYLTKTASQQINFIELYHAQKNRLWLNAGKLVETKKYLTFLHAGFTQACKTITIAQAAHAFDGWFARLKQGVIVRLLPLGSDALMKLVETTFSSAQSKKSLKEMAMEIIDKELGYAYSDWVTALKQTPASWQAFPLFLCLQGSYILDDLIHGDVPVFYHQVNTTDVLDSHGRPVTIPNTITIGSAVKDVQTLLHHATFFPHPPLDDIQTVQLVHFDTSIPQLDKELDNAIFQLQEQQGYDEAKNEEALAKSRISK